MPLLFLLFWALSDPPEILADLIWYRSFSTRKVAVDPTGRTFALNVSEKTIHRFDGDGRWLGQFSGPGKGPDRMENPRYLHISRDRLWLIDIRKVIAFDLDGNHQETQVIPRQLASLQKVPDGWLALSRTTSDFTKPMELFWLDQRFANKRSLYTWPSEAERYPFFVKYPRSFNPAADINLLTIDHTGRFAFVKPSNTDRIFIFDLRSKVITQTVVVEDPPLRFPREWGDWAVAQTRKRFPEIQTKQHFPEFLPVIHNIWVTRANRLVIFKYQVPRIIDDQFHYPDIWAAAEVYDFDGNRVEPKLLDIYHRRIAAIHHDRALVVTAGPDGEGYRLGWHRLTEIGTFLEAHPLPPVH